MRRIGLGWVVLGLLVTSASAQEGGGVSPPGAAIAETLRQNGPPLERPAEDPGPPPGVNVFYVPGEYVPDGDTVSWRRGFWAKLQPGWTWLPARWAKTSDGWTFHGGRWVRTRPVATTTTRSVVVSPVASYYVNPALGPGWGFPGYGYGYGLGYGGFGYYRSPSLWWGGMGLGGFGPAFPTYSPGFMYSYPFGMGWGYRPWGFGWGWGWW